MSLDPGTRLGPYEILARLGAGGMGEVYKARDTRLGRMVAIKTVNQDFSARFAREARAIAALNHPNICALYDVGPDYLVMEYVEGSPITGPIATPEALRYAAQIAQALEAAHAKGIVHRDLKPANILLGKSGVKLLDFGLAKVGPTSEPDGDETTTHTLAGTVLGTASYMSPEQASGKDADARADIFSFGVVLYELLSGRRAFKGDTPVATLAAVLHKEAEPLDAASGITQVVGRCMRKAPEDRYQTASDLRAALEQAAMKSTERQPSIAVLPFANMSRDADDEYFSDGLAEEIINALVKVPGLKVIARTSAFAFKGQNIDIRKIAETLGVTTILEGSVRRAGSRIRVTAQLITAADGMHLWSERYDRELADVFAVQDEISAAIAGALKLKLSPATARPRYIPKLDAHEALLKAKYFHWKVTFESMEQAKAFYEQAITLDPNYALAYAAYGDYCWGRTTLGMTPAREAAPLCQTLAQRALALDPSLPDARIVLAMRAGFVDYDWKEAESQCLLATATDGASALCFFVFGLCLMMQGRCEEASGRFEQAVQIDPLQTTIRTWLAMALGAVARDAEAEEQFRQTISLDANFFWAHVFLAEFYVARGRLVEAFAAAETAFSLAPWYPLSVGVYAGLLVRRGEADRGRALVAKLGAGEAFGSSAGWAAFHLCCGDTDRAADWNEKVIEERDPIGVQSLQTAIGEPLRAGPRWKTLAALLNLPAASDG